MAIGYDATNVNEQDWSDINNPAPEFTEIYGILPFINMAAMLQIMNAGLYELTVYNVPMVVAQYTMSVEGHDDFDPTDDSYNHVINTIRKMIGIKVYWTR